MPRHPNFPTPTGKTSLTASFREFLFIRNSEGVGGGGELAKEEERKKIDCDIEERSLVKEPRRSSRGSIL